MLREQREPGNEPRSTADPELSRLAPMAASDWEIAVRSVAATRPMTATTVAIAVTRSSQPAVRAAGSRGEP